MLPLFEGQMTFEDHLLTWHCFILFLHQATDCGRKHMQTPWATITGAMQWELQMIYEELDITRGPEKEKKSKVKGHS